MLPKFSRDLVLLSYFLSVAYLAEARPPLPIRFLWNTFNGLAFVNVYVARWGGAFLLLKLRLVVGILLEAAAVSKLFLSYLFLLFWEVTFRLLVIAVS